MVVRAMFGHLEFLEGVDAGFKVYEFVGFVMIGK
jgi:hypothetical protein